MKVENITSNDLAIAVAVIVAVCSLIAAVWKGVESFRKLSGIDKRKSQETAMREQFAQLSARVTKCEERLAKGDVQFTETRNDLTQTLYVLNAMLMHFISGNDHDKLKGVKDDLDRYLMHR